MLHCHCGIYQHLSSDIYVTMINAKCHKTWPDTLQCEPFHSLLNNCLALTQCAFLTGALVETVLQLLAYRQVRCTRSSSVEASACLVCQFLKTSLRTKSKLRYCHLCAPPDSIIKHRVGRLTARHQVCTSCSSSPK